MSEHRTILNGRFSLSPKKYAGTMPPNYGRSINITVDGEKVTRVFGFDTAVGEVARYKEDANGRLIINRDTEELEYEIIRGDVVATIGSDDSEGE